MGILDYSWDVVKDTGLFVRDSNGNFIPIADLVKGDKVYVSKNRVKPENRLERGTRVSQGYHDYSREDRIEAVLLPVTVAECWLLAIITGVTGIVILGVYCIFVIWLSGSERRWKYG